MYSRYFQRELERERDPFRRNLIEIQLREVEEKKEELMQLNAIQLMREIQFMKNALEKLDKKIFLNRFFASIYRHFR